MLKPKSTNCGKTPQCGFAAIQTEIAFAFWLTSMTCLSRREYSQLKHYLVFSYENVDNRYLPCICSDQLKVKFFSSECIRSQNRLSRPNRFSHFRMSLTILREHSTLFSFCSGDNSCPSPKFDHSDPQANVKLSDDDVTSICFGKEEIYLLHQPR